MWPKPPGSMQRIAGMDWPQQQQRPRHATSRGTPQPPLGLPPLTSVVEANPMWCTLGCCTRTLAGSSTARTALHCRNCSALPTHPHTTVRCFCTRELRPSTMSKNAVQPTTTSATPPDLNPGQTAGSLSVQPGMQQGGPIRANWWPLPASLCSPKQLVTTPLTLHRSCPCLQAKSDLHEPEQYAPNS